MSPADRRIAELIDRWLASIDLHLQYVELDDQAYARAQPWPKHERPTRWVLEVARQKVLELKEQCEARRAMGDGKFAESLELMAFLANLVGAQQIQRYIPLAQPGGPATGTPQQDGADTPAPTKEPARAPGTGDDTTREMPRLRPAGQAQNPRQGAAPQGDRSHDPPSPRQHHSPSPGARSQNATAQAGTDQSAHVQPGRSGARTPGAARSSATPRTSAATRAAAPKTGPADMKGKIIADAVRLLKWGKPWHELAELIARIAERPPVGEVRKVLRACKAEIEAKAR